MPHNLLHYLQRALDNDEKLRLFAFAYNPIFAFHADIRSLLRESLAQGFVQPREHGYLRQFWCSDHVVVPRSYR